MRTYSKRPKLKPDEHPRPHVDVPMSVFGDPFFREKHERIGRWVHAWCFAVWKKDPTYRSFFERDDEQLVPYALEYGWLVKRRGTLFLTGPNKDRAWLVGLPKTWTTYAIEALGQGTVKIGKATDVAKRLDGLQVASPHELVLLGTLKGDHESAIHRSIHGHRVGGEWFALNDETRAALREWRLL